MRRPRLLDLYCGAGGAAMGYHRAGFDVVGVDIRPQRHFPFEFHQEDALEFCAAHGREFDAIHASPPCQAYSMARRLRRQQGQVYPDLVAATREALRATGRPWVIENVPGAPLENPTVLNGALFGLRVRRVRWFETNFAMPLTLRPREESSTSRMGRPAPDGDLITPVGHFSNVSYARKVMGVDWMTRAELSQAIPPAYTEYIGRHTLAALARSEGLKE